MSKGNTRILRLLAIVMPPIFLGVASLFHPHQLTIDTAERWTLVHIILLPLFTLLGGSYYILLSRYKGWMISFAKICSAIFVVFYTALDTIAGIANGIVVLRLANMPDTPQRTEFIGVLKQSLFINGNYIGSIGIFALLGIALFTYIYAVENKPDKKTNLAMIGLIFGTGLFAFSHLYTPWGTLAIIIIAASMFALEIIGNKSGNVKK